MSRYLSARLAALAPYVPGEQPRDMRYIKLNTNESPYPPAPGVLDALSREAVSQLNLYSDPTCRALEAAIADFYGLEPAQVFAGNGSDEVLAFSFQAFADGRTGVCFPDISYGFYPVFAQLYGIDAETVPLRADLTVSPGDYHRRGRMIVLANPNAPTGLYLTPVAIEGIVRENPDHVVLIDEAYIDFGGESALPLIRRHENLLVVHTFSKSRNLAGARIGYAMGQATLIEDLRRVKFAFNPYSLDRLALLAGEAAVRDRRYFETCTRTIMKTRDDTAAALRARGFTLTDSLTNFVLARPLEGITGEGYYLALKARGILTRHFPQARVRDFVRITIGTPEQMQALLDATDAILAEAKIPEQEAP